MILNKNRFYTIILILYIFFVIVIEELRSNNVLLILFYAVFLLGIISQIYQTKIYPCELFICILGAIVIGAIGFVINGNISILKYFYMSFGICLALIFLSDTVNNNIFLYFTIGNAILIGLLFGIKEGNAQIFPESSNNYVSIYLMMTSCLYYIRADLFEKKYSLLPSIVVFVLSIIAGGRGGFIASTILFVPVLFYKILSKRNRVEKILLIMLLVIAMCIVIYPLLLRFIENNTDIELIQRFSAKAMTSNYRIYCWREYLQSCMGNWLYFMFGSDLSRLYWVGILEGNLHNSFLFVHAYAGIIGVLFIIIANVRAIKFSIRNKKWIYLFSLFAFEFRSFTDHVFGANRLTPFFYAILLAPDIIQISARLQRKMKGI